MNRNREYIGCPAQLFSVRNYRFDDGRAANMRATIVDNGSGLRFTVLPDRCMDLYDVSFHGVNQSFLSGVEAVSPQFFKPEGMQPFYSFAPGFLTTCGLDNIGSPCEDATHHYGLHGLIGNAPASAYSALLSHERDSVSLSGWMQQGRLFDDHLTLHRTWNCTHGQNELTLTDTVRNEGYRKSAYSLLYHINLGYPMLCEEARLILPTKQVTPRDAYAAQFADDYARIFPPQPDRPEMCYYHTLRCDANGMSVAGLYNPVHKLGFYYEFSTRELRHFVQWKSMGSGEYVLGLEPCTCTIEGRVHAGDDGTLRYLDVGACASFSLRFVWFEGEDAFSQISARAEKML